MPFQLGRIVSTVGALKAFERTRERPLKYLERHYVQDWGDLDQEDKEANDRALKESTRILSAYHLTDGTKIWCITEGDRSATTFLLPEEY